jgi:hypothetical protein
MHGDEIILEYQAVTIILQTLPGTGLTRSDLPIGARPPRTERTHRTAPGVRRPARPIGTSVFSR